MSEIELRPDGVPSIGPALRLESERVVLAAPLSFQSSAIRIWRGVAKGRNGWMGALAGGVLLGPDMFRRSGQNVAGREAGLSNGGMR